MRTFIEMRTFVIGTFAFLVSGAALALPPQVVIPGPGFNSNAYNGTQIAPSFVSSATSTFASVIDQALDASVPVCTDGTKHLITAGCNVVTLAGGTLTGNLTAPQLISNIATGTPPFGVTSTTVVPNLNVSQLLGKTWAAPGPFGGTTPDVGNFTQVVSSTYGLMTGLNVINMVDQLGLKCDNSTDNAGVFTALHNKTNGHPGFFVYFPPQAQACLTSSFMTLDSGTTYWAENTVTLKPTAGSVAAVLLAVVSNFATNVYTYGLTFDGALSSSQTNSANVIQMFNGTNVVFDNITVQNTRGVAMLLSYSTGLTNSGVRNSHFNNVGNFWRTSGSAGDRKQAVAFTGPTVPINSYGNFANNNWFNDTGLDDIQGGHLNDFTATGNHCFQPSYQFTTLSASAYNACVFISTTNNAVITNNTAIGLSGNSFDINSGALAVATGITVCNNLSIGAGQAGVSLGGTITGFVGCGNQIYNSNQWSGSVQQGGISVGGTIDSMILSANVSGDNQVTKTQKYGVQYYTASGIAPVVTNSIIDANNILINNLVGPFNGGAAYTNPAILRVGTLYSGSGALIIPSCVSALAASWASVSDGKSSPTYNSAYAAADGSSTRSVYCDGTSWTYH